MRSYGVRYTIWIHNWSLIAEAAENEAEAKAMERARDEAKR